MTPLGCISMPREKLLELQARALAELVNALLSVTRLGGSRKVTRAFNSYLSQQGLRPGNNKDVLAWLQSNQGDVIGAFILSDNNGNFEFVLKAGTQTELTQIGREYVEKSNTA